MFSRRLFREIFREFQEFFGEVSQAVLILSISVDTFLQGYECLSCSIQRFIIPLSFDHRREPIIGRAYPPVIPVADEVSPDERL